MVTFLGGYCTCSDATEPHRHDASGAPVELEIREPDGASATLTVPATPRTVINAAQRGRVIE